MFFYPVNVYLPFANPVFYPVICWIDSGTYYLASNIILSERSSPSFAFNVNPFMHNVVKWPNILLKSCGVHICCD